ncbi:MAG: helix-turn-helix domain-containing protein, partial [Dehalococcoidia bacterium]
MENRQIKEIRGRLDLSQERFAQLLGVSLQTVRRWESGLTKPLPIINLKLERLQRKTMAPKRTVGGVPPVGGIPMRGVRREKGGAGEELGMGGMFKGIGSLLDLVSRMA